MFKNVIHHSLPNESGIYAIHCYDNNKIYIGSSKKVRDRIRDHFSYLISGIHDNKYIQNSFNKYGYNSFNVKLLELCPIENLLEREQWYIDNLKPEFNISTIAGAPMSGLKHSKETKDKISFVKRRENLTLETRAKMSSSSKGENNHFYGKTHTKEIKEKISKTHKGKIPVNRKLTEEQASEIREKYKYIKSYSKLAKMFYVSYSTIERIINNKNYSKAHCP